MTGTGEMIYRNVFGETGDLHVKLALDIENDHDKCALKLLYWKKICIFLSP